MLNGETDGRIRLDCGNDLFTVKNVLLCTGSETVIPPIEGLSDVDYWTSREGEVAVNHILGHEDWMDYRAIPTVVYTNPEVAGVDKTEEELKANREYYNLVKTPMTYSGRFVAENTSSCCGRTNRPSSSGNIRTYRTR